MPATMVIEIEYCVPCGSHEMAVETRAGLLATVGRDLAEVRFVPGGGGVFGVSVDGETVWDRDVHGDGADTDAIADAVEARLEAG